MNALLVSGVLAVSSAFLLRRLEAAEVEAERLALAVANAPDAIVVMDASGQILQMNTVATAIADEFTDGSGWRELDDFAQSEAQREQLRGALLHGEPVALSIARRLEQGDVELSGQIMPIRRVDGTVDSIVAVFRDVTRERQTEASLRRAERLEALSVLARTTAHDFNNALGQILAVAESARSRTESTHVRTELDAIVGAGDRARDLVRQLGAFGERSDLGRVAVDVGQVVHESLPLLRAALSPMGVSLTVEVVGTAAVLARPSEIDQIVTNLVTNAAHAASRCTDPMVTVEVVGATAATHGSPKNGDSSVTDHSVLRIRDNGEGIRPDQLDRIFEPYYTTRSTSGGTGLGLSSVKGIVESLNGSVTVASTVGDGATFEVLLPCAQRTPVEPAIPGDGVQAANILLVDDEPLLCNLAAQGLTHGGYTVTTAADGNEALALYSATPDRFALIITDLNMLGFDGFELIGAIRQLRANQPVILCSGEVNQPTLPQGVSAWLAKPYTLTELLDTVALALAGHTRSD